LFFTYFFPSFGYLSYQNFPMWDHSVCKEVLPAGDLHIAVGYEHRKEQGRFVPDAFAQSGESTGLQATTTEGDYSLDEFYVELNIPVLADMVSDGRLPVGELITTYDFADIEQAVADVKSGATIKPVLTFG
jgi:iron complex outermembrane receptor protein